MQVFLTYEKRIKNYANKARKQITLSEELERNQGIYLAKSKQQVRVLRNRKLFCQRKRKQSCADDCSS
jgi:hypothetical protein